MESIWISSKPIKWILITLISHAFQSRFLQFSNLSTFVSVPGFNVKTSFLVLLCHEQDKLFPFISGKTCIASTYNLPNWTICMHKCLCTLSIFLFSPTSQVPYIHVLVSGDGSLMLHWNECCLDDHVFSSSPDLGVSPCVYTFNFRCSPTPHNQL